MVGKYFLNTSKKKKKNLIKGKTDESDHTRIKISVH